MFEIFIAQNTQKKFKKFSSSLQEELRKEILLLKEFPNLKNLKKLTTKENIWRLKYKQYRIVFTVNKDDKNIKITHIRKRNEKTYKNL